MSNRIWAHTQRQSEHHLDDRFQRYRRCAEEQAGHLDDHHVEHHAAPAKDAAIHLRTATDGVARLRSGRLAPGGQIAEKSPTLSVQRLRSEQELRVALCSPVYP